MVFIVFIKEYSINYFFANINKCRTNQIETMLLDEFDICQNDLNCALIETIDGYVSGIFKLCDAAYMLKLLIKYGADVHASNDHVLKRSAKHGCMFIVELVLKHGANVHASGGYALKWSAKNGWVHIVALLLEAGASVGTHCSFALKVGLANKDTSVVDCLLKYGGDICQCNKEMKAALEDASHFNKELADVIFPYCRESDYELFPLAYIKAKTAFITKSARTCDCDAIVG